MMKFIFHFLIILPLFTLSQTVRMSGTIVSSEDRQLFPGVSIQLLNDEAVVKETGTDINGMYILEDITPGIYDLKIRYIGFREKIISGFKISDNLSQIDFIYPEPCDESKRVCPKGHTNDIIPILYGFPSKKMIRKAEKGKIILGGCDASPCEKWHCKTHNIDF